MIFGRELFSGEGECLPTVVNHLPHLADALGALRRAAVALEDVSGTPRARLDGEGHVTLPKTIAVADVHEGRSGNSVATGSP